MPKQLLDSIVSHKYLATDAQVIELAGLVVIGQRAGGTYLGVLIAHVQKELPARGRKPSKETAEAAVDTVHGRLYPCVLKGVGNGDIDDKERNRRATFARTAASDLRYFINAGGDVRQLDPAAVSKGALRKEGREVPTGTRAERSFSKANATLLRAVQRIARSDPDEAVERLRETIAALEELAEEIESGEQKPARRARKKAAPVRHRPSERATSERRSPSSPPNTH